MSYKTIVKRKKRKKTEKLIDDYSKKYFFEKIFLKQRHIWFGYWQQCRLFRLKFIESICGA